MDDAARGSRLRGVAWWGWTLSVLGAFVLTVAFATLLFTSALSLEFPGRQFLSAMLGGEASQDWVLEYRSDLRWWVAAIVAASAWILFNTTGSIATWKRWLPHALARLTLLILLVGVMLPHWSIGFKQALPTSIYVAIDVSGSMGTSDVGPGKQARLEAVKRALTGDDHEILSRLLEERRCQIHLVAIGDQLRTLGVLRPERTADGAAMLEGLEPTGASSGLATQLDTLLQTTDARLLLICSDGRVTEGLSWEEVARRSRRRGTALHFVLLGKPPPAAKLTVQATRHPDVIYAGTEATLGFFVGYEGPNLSTDAVAVRVRLWDRGRDQLLEVRRITLQPSGPLANVTFAPRFDQVGWQDLEVGAELVDDPAERGNVGAAEWRGQVLVLTEPKLRVLWLDGTPRYEWRAFRDRAATWVSPLDRSSTVHLETALGTEAQAITARLRDRWDVIVLGDLPVHAFAAVDLEALSSHVVRGGGIIFVPGPERHDHSWLGSKLADLLPVATRTLAKSRGEPAALRLFVPNYRPVPGAPHNWPLLWTSDVAASWHVDDVQPRSDARLLADVRYLGPLEAQILEMRPPLLVERDSGRGRTLWIGWDETWRWLAKGEVRAYDEYWLGLLRRAKDPMADQTWLRVEPAGRLRAGQDVSLTASVPQDLSQPRARPMVQVRYAPPSHAPSLLSGVPLVAVTGERQRWRGSVRGLREGSYHFELTGAELVKVEVAGSPKEADDVTADAEGVRRAAAMTQGTVHRVEDLSGLLEALPEGTSAPSRIVRVLPIWSHPLVWGTLLLLLVGDWLLSRKEMDVDGHLGPTE